MRSPLKSSFQPRISRFNKLAGIGFPILGLMFVGVLSGCARSKYRKAADQEAYCLIESRETDPRWQLPNRRVEPRRDSRMYLANERDCGPKPADDPAAHRYMVNPDCRRVTYYDEIATRNHVENPIWLDHLRRNENGQVEMSPTLAIELALLHSREYQSEFESIYLSALSLSGNRFEFDTQWIGGTGATYAATGSDLGGNRVLALSRRLGFGRNLAGGGQFATDVFNGLSWNFGTGGVQAGSAAIVASFTQPLLRGAFRHVRLENLTQAERDLLYQVRDFARFRRQFYVNITESYLGLLTQNQAIRNTENNVQNLYDNWTEHEFLQGLEMVTQVQVDQVFQEYQRGRRSLLTAQQNVITSEDQFKFSMGLPAWVELQIDESLLEPFEFVDERLIGLQDEAQQLYSELVQYLPPRRAPTAELKAFFERYKRLRTRAFAILPEIRSDLERWKNRLESTPADQIDDPRDFEQQEKLAAQITQFLDEIQQNKEDRGEFDADVQKKLIEYEANPEAVNEKGNQKTLKEILQNVESLDEVTIEDVLPDEVEDPAEIAWASLENAIGNQLRQEIADLYVAQTQVKLFLIEIERIEISSETAITYAHQNRLDVMNSKAIVMDAFRRVEVAADALESDLDVSGQVNVGSDPNSNSPFKLDSANNRYTLGLQLDGPLNRLNERNAYRATQIAYQRASRDYIASKDRVANEVRQILRRLELSRLNFQIARQQVVAATRQVDQAQIALRQSTESNANVTLILLQALAGMLDAKNSLIFNWVDYRVQKMRLFVALEMLYLDENGVWLNEDTGLQMLQGQLAIDPEYFPMQPSFERVPQTPPNLTEPLPGPIELIESDVDLLNE